MDRVLNYRAESFGFLILWIVLFHLERVVGLPIYLPIITPFIQRGNCAVDIFMFLSGFCLCLSLKREYNIIKFYSKRFKRVVISYLLVAIPFFIWKSFQEYSTSRLVHFFFDLSGLSFWFRGCQNAWFVHAIIAFYLITPLLFKLVKKDIRNAFFCLCLLYVLNFIAYYSVSFYQYSSVALMRLPIFFIGLLLAYYVPHFDFRNKRAFLVLFLMLGFIFLMYFPSRGFYCWFLYGAMVIPILWLISFAFNRLSRIFIPLFSTIGKISLELYLCHIMILHIFRFYKVEQFIGYWMYFVLPFLAIFCSFLVANMGKKIANYIIINI